MVAVGFSPSIRLFEAAACSTPILSDVWDGLDTVFTPDREIVLVRSADDVLAALDRDEPGRQALGRAARDRVLQGHTAAPSRSDIGVRVGDSP